MMLAKSSPLRVLLFALLLAGGGLYLSGMLSSPASAVSELEPVEGGLEPEAEHRKAARAVVKQLQNHYRQLRIDDDISGQVLDRYLKDLDPNRIHFTREDVDDFDGLRDELADRLRQGDLEAGFRIFNIQRRRAADRLEYKLGRLEEGLDNMDFSTDAQVTLDRSEAPWAEDEGGLRELWDQRLKNAVLAMRLDGVEDEEIAERLERRFHGQGKRISQSNAEDAFQAYMNALTRTFDPHTAYFTPRRSENFNISMSRSLEGIGAVLKSEDEYVQVVRLVPGGPAAQQGQLQPADRIVGVAQEDEEMVNVIGWRLDEVVDRIRGPKGSEVTLEVIPSASASEHSTREITITRNEVELEDQRASREIIEVPGKDGETQRLGVITVPGFYMDFEAYRRGDPDYTSTTRDVARLLSELQEEGIDGLMVDLRNNGGGSLHEATQLVSLFISDGPAVQVRDYRGRVQVEEDSFPGMLYDGPMAVLVNRFSASASEIFAGAMQDYGRALVVGDDTYGKGTVQTMLPLNHGQLKITQAKFYRVSGASNQHMGVVPDIRFPYLVDKEQIGESALPNALPWDQIDAVNYQRMFDPAPLLPSLRQRHEDRISEHPEFVYVREQLSLLEERRDRKTASLNEEQRRKQERDWEQRRLEVENDRRRALGKEPVESVSELEPVRFGGPEPGLEEDEEQEREKDPYIMETGAILGDMITMLHKQKMAASKE